ncbi:MAG TPA: monovalent cation/H+ antiporter complex subunit F [Actinocrinis sp.]|nr:monovalent cation/H+ antiporter complex subunit F [Actinocrinis sp.]
MSAAAGFGGPDVAQVASGVVLIVAGALVLWRLVAGPSVLDRSIALDTLTSLCLIAVALVACVQRSGALLPVLLVVSLVGFTGSVSVARFAAGRDGLEVSAEDDSAGAAEGQDAQQARDAESASGGSNRGSGNDPVPPAGDAEPGAHGGAR